MKRLVLEAKTVADLMTPNPVSMTESATVGEASWFLTHRELSAVPVINDAGRPVGVLSRADLIRYQGRPSELKPVREIMTPTVVALAPEDAAWEAVAKMAAFKVHRVFVVDGSGVLVGVVSAFDLVRKLRSE